MCAHCLKLTGLSCKNAAICADAVKAEYSYHIELAFGLSVAFRISGWQRATLVNGVGLWKGVAL